MSAKESAQTTAVETNVDGHPSSYHLKDAEWTQTGPGDGNKTAQPVSHDVAPETHRDELTRAMHEIESQKNHWYSYMATREFWMVLALGQVLSLCITATNTFSTLLVNDGTSLPAFQNLLNYILLTSIWLPIALYKYGFKGYCSLYYRRGGKYGIAWKYAILSFFDVEGNYFTVLAYRYTNLLSAQLLNFWSIVCVVIISFFVLKVRYGWIRIFGILVCCGGMGLLLASDAKTAGTAGHTSEQVKGDLFGLLGATFYGLSNVFEEWMVSKRPIYETLSFLGLFGVLILGAQTAIFDRESFVTSTWDGNVAGWLVGYAIVLTFFYSIAPLMFRLGSAAFFDISLLTANFWGAIIGIHVFGYTIYYWYPIAFVMIIIGLVIYFVSGSILGDSKKPWLGENQEQGVVGVGTAKRRALVLAQKGRDAAEGAHAA